MHLINISHSHYFFIQSSKMVPKTKDMVNLGLGHPSYIIYCALSSPPSIIICFINFNHHPGYLRRFRYCNSIISQSNQHG
mmetsp:Transcript_10968/g.20489  ORF Transcript_10968/g.20489 Transcript_10968/m.20489 type:complete len:80 (-) Transcript_10968:302-541(-)